MRHHPELRPTWRESDRFVPSKVLRPALRFTEVEASGAIVMLAAAIVALVWANSPWVEGYRTLWDTAASIHIGGFIHLDLTLHGWVNDALMTLFFLLAGMEIKRQLTTGELRDPKAAALPALAALGGMIVPALIFVAFNSGHAGSRGWGIPVATDIAFAVGVVALVGKSIPVGARIFLLTLAVVDDVGGIVVIAVAYASDVRLGWLLPAAAAAVACVFLQRVEVRSMGPYAVLGLLCWYSLHQAGVEAAIAGVVFGLLTPVRPFFDPTHFGEVARRLVDRIESSDEIATEDLARYATETASPLERIENRLNLWVSFVVVPLFALANAGVRINTGSIDARVLLGVGFGLVIGKTVGVFAFSWLAVRLGLGRLPSNTTWAHMLGLAITAGIGFTVALFVTGLSFDNLALTDSAKLAIVLASAVAGAAGFAALKIASRQRQ